VLVNASAKTCVQLLAEIVEEEGPIPAVHGGVPCHCAGQHGAKALTVPANISLLPLPPRSPSSTAKKASGNPYVKTGFAADVVPLPVPAGSLRCVVTFEKKLCRLPTLIIYREDLRVEERCVAAIEALRSMILVVCSRPGLRGCTRCRWTVFADMESAEE
jgi:hypothetical protein